MFSPRRLLPAVAQQRIVANKQPAADGLPACTTQVGDRSDISVGAYTFYTLFEWTGTGSTPATTDLLKIARSGGSRVASFNQENSNPFISGVV